MNETDVKELFASVAANPAADTIDMDAVMRGGRRGHRTRVAATLGASLGALAVVGVLITGVLPGNAPTPVAPTPTATASQPVGLVTSVDQLVGTWTLTDVGRGSGGTVPGVSVALMFAADGKWQALGSYWCPPRGTFTVGGDGRFTAGEAEPNLTACPKSTPDITQAVQLTLVGEAPGPRTLTMRTAEDQVLAVWSTVGRPWGCQSAALPAPDQGSLQDQQDVDDAAERVRQTARVQATNNYSSLAVDPGNRTVILWWVGPVPAAFTELTQREKDRGITLEVREAAYTQSQMSAAMQKAMDLRLPGGYKVGMAAGCNDGSGIWVGIADSSGGVPSEVPASVVQALNDALSPMPVEAYATGAVVPAVAYASPS